MEKIHTIDKAQPLHRAIVNEINREKVSIKKRQNPLKEQPGLGEKFTDVIFRAGTTWIPILAFTSVVILWIGFNMLVSKKYSFDPYPFSLITFILAIIAAIQAPVIMMSQYRQDRKNCKQIAVNLKVETEILTYYQSITVLMQKQLQQVHENQLCTITLLQVLQGKIR